MKTILATFISPGSWPKHPALHLGKTILALVLLLTATWVRADVIQTFSPDMTIPEGDPAGAETGVSFTMDSSDGTVGSITVGLVTSGGYNGDLYAYLVAPNGTMVTLMNQPGTAVDSFGAQSSGMNITLDDDAESSIQNVTGGAGTTLTGTYQADGTLGNFGNSTADGTWNIFFADLGSGGSSPELDSVTLDIDVEPVPEPANVALGLFLGVLVAGAALRWAARKMFHRPSGVLK